MATKKSSQAEIEAMEMERVFSGNIYIKWKATLFYGNLLNVIRKRTTVDISFWRTAMPWFKHSDIIELENTVIPKSMLRKADSYGHEDAPNCQNGDTLDDICEWCFKHREFRSTFLKKFGQIITKRCEEFNEHLNKNEQSENLFQKRIDELRSLLGLEDKEIDLLLILYFNQYGLWDLGSVLNTNRYDGSIGNITHDIADTLILPESEVVEMLGEKQRLRKFGIIADPDDFELDRTFVRWLSGAGEQPLSERFYTKFDFSTAADVLPWNFYDDEMRKHGDQIRSLIEKKAKGDPAHFLLCGVPGCGKSSFVVSLAKEMGYDLYKINASEEDNSNSRYSANFRYAAVETANAQLKSLGSKSIIMIDEADAMITNRGNFGGLLSILGIPPDRSSETKSVLTNILDSVTIPCIWIGNSRPEELDEATKRRFQLSMICDKLSVNVSKHIWKNALKRYNVSENLTDLEIERIAKTWELSAGGITNSVRSSAIVSSANKKEFISTLQFYIKNHASLMGISAKKGNLNPVKNYSLDLVNIKSGIPLDLIVKAAGNYLSGNDLIKIDSPQFNILCSGPSGAGKSEFARYLAHKLGRPLHVKNIDELQSSYVGQTEKNIARAFRDAHDAGAVLVLDEVDALLGHRSSAQRSWEISQTNTLLQSMEAYQGNFILICTTNIMKNLDPASMRRFTFKIALDYLTADQIEGSYRNVFGIFNLPPLSEQERVRLRAVERLCPGDFKVVCHSYFYLKGSSELTNMRLIEALRSETESRMEAAKSNDLDTSRSIGF